MVQNTGDEAVAPGAIEVGDHIRAKNGPVCGTVQQVWADTDGVTFDIGDKTPTLRFSHQDVVRRIRDD